VLRERPGAPLLAGAEAAIPQVDERREAGLQREEAEAIAGVGDVAAVVLLDQRFHPGARLPRRLGQAAREEHVVFGFELLQISFEALQIAFDALTIGHGLPTYLGRRNQTSGSHSSRA